MKFGEYKIIKYSSKYKNQVLELQKQLWGSDVKNNRAYFEWKYEQNPLVDEIPALIALFNGRVVAFRGFFPQAWCLENGAELKILSPSDLVVDSAHRRKGLFKALTKASFSVFESSGFKFFLNLSSNEKSSPGYLKMGWVPLMKRWYLIRYSWQGWIMQLIYKAFRMKTLKPVATLIKRLRFSVESLKMGKASTLISFPVESGDEVFEPDGRQLVDSGEYRFDEVDRLQKELSRGSFSHVHSREYMNWRMRSPRHNYRYIYCYKEGALAGYLILSRSAGRKGRLGHVVDYGILDDRVLSILMRHILKKYKLHGLQWTVYGNERGARYLFKKGFRIHQELNVLIRPVCPLISETDWVCADGNVLDEERWHIRGICSDGV